MCIVSIIEYILLRIVVFINRIETWIYFIIMYNCTLDHVYKVKIVLEMIFIFRFWHIKYVPKSLAQ